MKEIGQEIQQARLEKGITLEEIAARSRIQVSHLQKIENGQLDFLPRPYVVAFVKTFAQIVGLNGEALIGRWREQEQAESLRRQEQQRPKAVATKAKNRRLPTALPAFKEREGAISSLLRQIPYLKEILIGFGMVLFMVALIYLVSRSEGENKQPAGDARPGAAQRNERSPERGIPFSEVAKEVAAKSQAGPRGGEMPAVLTLQAQFDGQSWLRVVSDGADTSDFVYRRGNTQSWQAKEKFKVNIGNAGAVTLFLDGKNLGKIGQAGQVATLTITREGIVEQRVNPVRPRRNAPQEN
jgi:transcriptional regulator with XRE-family HTH domain